MDPDRTAWEQAYRNRADLWAETCAPLPDLPCGSSVLELGCGNARSLTALMRKGWNVTALDFSEAAVTTARTNSLPCGECSILLADAGNIPVRDRCMDMVIASHVMGHMRHTDRIHCAGEILRVLRPGGIVVFREFSQDDFRFALSGSPPDGTVEKKTGIRTHYFTLPEVTDLFLHMTRIALKTHTPVLRIRGTEYQRSEICAVFQRNDD